MASTLTELAHLQIPLEDVVKATNNFADANIVGNGEFGPAYNGQLLWSGKLIKIAAMRLDRRRGLGVLEFLTEVSLLSDLKHPNLVSFIGFCDEKDEKIIVIKHEPNGSLMEHLNNPNLTWTQRLRISIGVARALSYLHHDEGRDYGVIHRNINSDTILLDENWEAKLSGFTLSIKQLVNRMDQVVLCESIGIYGYVDPAIEKIKGASPMSDIYSLGVVLFEILCGRKAFILKHENGLLAPLAIRHYEEKKMKDIIYPNIWNDQMFLQSLEIYSKVAYSCLNEKPTQRPHMLNVVIDLQRALESQLRRENLVNNLERLNIKHLKINLSDIKLATNNFSKPYDSEIFEYYTVELKNFDKENPSSVDLRKNKGEHPKGCDLVLIKRYPFEHYLYGEKAFFTEIEKLTSVKHPNIVTLLGFCIEGSEMILVIENISNNYLGDYFEDEEKRRILTWEKRLKICIDVARALNYLHSEMEDGKIVINRYIHLHNIVLDDKWRAKIVDFWFSMFLSPCQEEDVPFESNEVYTDPEYEKTGKLNKESDVYSFGIVLFQVLCGKIVPFGLVHKVLPHMARLSTTELEKLVDPLLKENQGPNENSWHTFFEVICDCAAETQNQRPTMKVVVNKLEKALFYQEDQLQPQHIGQVVNELENPSELESTQEPTKEKQCIHMKEVEAFKLTGEILGMDLKHLKICLNDIKFATNNFSEMYRIASDSFYTCYRGTLHFDKENPTPVVIKRITYERRVYEEEEFIEEIKLLTCVKHPNIATLLGICAEDSEMILVFENISNGYLKDYLENNNKLRILTWEKRLKICIDVAHALNYLHYGMEDPKMVINLDICSPIIGLDENLRAKIVGLHFSVLLIQEEEDPCFICKFRSSYTDPVLLETHLLKRDVDVYSFGVVLLEILCGRPAYDPMFCKEDCKGLVRMARSRKLEQIIDPIIKEEFGEKNFVLNRGTNMDSLQTFIEIANQCVKTPDERPTMKVVLKKLEKSLLFQELKKDYRRISLVNIKRATQNFHDDNCIGKGGFGNVYKGNLQDGDSVIAIVAKRLDMKFGQGEQQFLCELQILLEYKHANVIGLVGYCDEVDEKIVVYEYASRGSLNRYLNNGSLTWVERLDICIDIASALSFLHEGVEKQAKLIHRDIKTSNILLSHDWKAKLGDFGLSLISPLIQETDYVIDHVCGTHGYMDPLYKKLGYLTIESDIYSFGVVLFEILCGISTYSTRKQTGEFLADFITNNFEEGKCDKVVFKPIREQIKQKSLAIFQKIAYQCLHHEREKRPTTKEVLTELKKAMEYQKMASSMTKFAHLQIPLEEVVKATNNFHEDNIVKHFGFGTSYEGQLLWSRKKMKIIARRFDCQHGEGDLEFLTEISVLSELKHTNLVTIIGFCDEKHEKIIVTRYETNRSLGLYLDSANLTWTQRLRICVSVARTLSYIHHEEDHDYAIIRCHVNSDTILLDENWEAMLSGLEISIKQPGCYLDPSIEKTGGMTKESVIYSFGVVLFEILCGRKEYTEKQANKFLVSLAKSHYENKTLHDIIHFDLVIYPQSLSVYSSVAYSCLNEDKACRPSIKYIVGELEKALELHLSIQNIKMASSMTKFAHLQIPLEEVVKATNNFHEDNIVKHFGFGTSYEGQLLWSRKKMKIIARRFDCQHGEGDLEFLTEISVLSELKHTNLVTIIGFCDEKHEKIIVTRYETNRSLGLYLDSANLTWTQRLRICVSVARTLSYIHHEEDHDYAIIRCHVNSDTILLDENWEAMLSGLEISIKQPGCYLDPSIEKTGGMTKESVIYSFGVVLFEILCGRKEYTEKQANKFLVSLAKSHYENKTLHDIIHFDLVIYPQSLSVYSSVAYSCLNEDKACRPSIKYIVGELEKALELHLSIQNIGVNFKHLNILLTDIKFATGNFSEKYIISSNPCYTCYRAELKKFDKQNPSSVVIKRISSGQDLYHEEHFVREIDVLTCVKHPNIVDLFGFCVEASEMILVIDNVSNGNLFDQLKNNDKRHILTWEKRLKICIDIARALNYLHFEMEDQKMIIIHNMYSHNIWLDENGEAKIVNFHQCAFLPRNQKDGVPLKRLDLPSYINPDYKKSGKLKRESDVYCFGVALFEILCGRLANDRIYIKESILGLAHVARQRFSQGTIVEMIDPVISRGPNKNSLLTFIEIAYKCVGEAQDHRPSMKVVLKDLEKALFFQENNKDNTSIPLDLLKS